MRKVGYNARAGERGAVSIKTVLVLVLLAAGVLLIIQIVPAYVEQRQVTYEVEEMARIASVRNFNEDKINQEIEKIRAENDLPDGSITLVARDKTVKVKIAYSRNLNLLVTNYVWRVERDVVGKSL